MKRNASLKINPAYVLNKSPHFVIVKKSKPKQTLSIESLLAEHGDFVYKFIRKRTWNEQNCDDLYQSTMEEALKSFKNFRGDSQPRTWLCGIAYNVIRSYAKTLNGYNVESLDCCSNVDSVMYHNSFGTEDPSDIYTRHLQIDKIGKAFHELPNNMRATFDQVVSQGKSYEETACTLNLPIGTVRSRVSRAREIIREKTLCA